MPISIFNLIRKKLTLVDIRLDRELFVQYTLLKILYYSFQEEYKLAKKRKTGYDIRYFNEWENEYRMPSGNFNREGIASSYLDRLAKAFIKEEGNLKKIIDYEEFETLVQEEDPETLRLLDTGIKLFKNFKVDERPVLWTLLTVNACIYYILIELKGNPNASYDEITKILEDFFIMWEGKYSDNSSSFELQYKHSKIAKEYLLEKIKYQLK